jgi:uncharacterized protein YbaR (Trm112 family)
MRMNTEELLKILACPKCLSQLQALPSEETPMGFSCDTCAVVYPIRDDIPVMLIDEAIPRKDWDAGATAVTAG